MTDLEAAGAYGVSLDVTDDRSMVDCVDRIIGEQERIDVLVSNVVMVHRALWKTRR